MSATQKQTKQAAGNSGYYYTPNTIVNYPDPAGYVPQGSGLDMDVDAYNRRGQFLVADSVPADSLDALLDSYAYTRRIEKFSNPDIVNGSGNQALIDSYYSQPATDINVYVVNASPWATWPYSSWYSPWYNWYGPSWSWSWNMGWYDPWYSWSWGWGPGYWPGYAPGWGPAWGPSWGPGWHPAPGPGHWAGNSTGGSRPHNPAGGSSTIGRRPGAISAGASVARPGNMGNNRYNGTVSPAYPNSRPASTGTSGSNGLNLNRGRNNSTSTSTPSRNSSWGNSTPSRNTGTYRSTGGSTTRSTGGGMRTGGGGGGTRGRR